MKTRAQFYSILTVALILSISSTSVANQTCLMTLTPSEREQSQILAKNPLSFAKIDSLGFTPEITHQVSRKNDSHVSSKVVLWDLEKMPIASLQYSFSQNGQMLVIDHIETNLNFRKLGLTETMLAEILNLHPAVKIIDGTLMEENAQIIDHKRREGKSLEQAILESPAGRLRMRFGFSKILVIKDYSMVESSYHLQMSR